MGYAVDVLLTGDDDPDLAPALGAQFLHDGLQIQHQPGIVADVLADFVHQKYQVEIFALAFHIFRYFPGEPVDAQLRGLLAVEPVSGRLFRKARRLFQGRHYVVAPEGEGLPGRFPGFGVDFLKGLFEGLQLALPVQEPLQGRHLHVVAVIAAVFVKDLGEHPQDGILILAHGGFRVDVEQDYLRGRFAHPAHHGVPQGVVIEFFFKIIQRPFAADLLVGQQVGKNLQKVGFTAAKEAGNPHADFVRGPVDPLFVMSVKGPEVLL